MTSGPISEPSAPAPGVSGENVGKAWRAIWLVTAGALAALMAIDLALKAVLGAPVHLNEVSEAIATYEHSDPDILVLGSSHARSFDSVAARLSQRTGGRTSLLSVPLEGGKLSGYFWIVKHRLAPIIEERTSGGQLRRPRLDKAILITEWWDSCSYDDGGLNIPGRGWTFRDFLNDVIANGITGYNRSYVSAKWSRALASVGLVRNRTIAWIPGAVRQRFYPPGRREAYFADATENWQGMVERGATCIGAPEQMAALDSTLSYFTGRDLAVTILLYPRKPGTITQVGKANTLDPYSRMIREHAARFPGVEVVDIAYTSPLTDDDFGADFDHVTAPANGRFATWVLDGPLASLVVRDSSKVGAQ